MGTIATLTEEVHRLQAENSQLRRRRFQEQTPSVDSHLHKQNENATACNRAKRVCIEESRSMEDHKMSQLSSLNQLFQESKPSSVKSLPCAHKNGGSALGDAMDEFAFNVIDDLDNFFEVDTTDVRGSNSENFFLD